VSGSGNPLWVGPDPNALTAWNPPGVPADPTNPLASVVMRNPVGTQYLPGGAYGVQSVSNQGPPGSFDALRGMPGGQPMMQSDLDRVHAQLAQARDLGTTLALGMVGDAPGAKPAGGFVAYHGSPHDFDAFDSSKIGTGEGAQAFGHGLYLADAEATAKTYRENGSNLDSAKYDGGPYNPNDPAHRAAYYIHDRNNGDVGAALKSVDSETQGLIDKMAESKGDAEQNTYNRYRQAAVDRLTEMKTYIESGKPIPSVVNPGRMYEVHVAADPAHFLDWDKPLSEQSPQVQERLSFLRQMQQVPRNNNAGGETTGGQMVNYLHDRFGDPQVVAQELHGEGIPGIRYSDAGSRGTSGGTKNTVVFDPKLLTILRKYAVPAAMLSGTGHGLTLGGAATDTEGQ
jgi:hypothetical protein